MDRIIETFNIIDFKDIEDMLLGRSSRYIFMEKLKQRYIERYGSLIKEEAIQCEIDAIRREIIRINPRTYIICA